jgi:hypothetical protein
MSVPATVTWWPWCTPDWWTNCIVTRPCVWDSCPWVWSVTVNVTVTYWAFSQTYTITWNDTTTEENPDQYEN